MHRAPRALLIAWTLWAALAPLAADGQLPNRRFTAARHDRLVVLVNPTGQELLKLTDEQKRLALLFLAAAGASLALYLIPYGRYVLYPFALLATWAHEMGHGLTALVCGGVFDKLVLYSNLGGTAYSASPCLALPRSSCSLGIGSSKGSPSWTGATPS